MNASERRDGPSWPRLVAIQFNLILRSGRWVELMVGVVVMLGVSIFGVWTLRPAMNRPMTLSMLIPMAQGAWVMLVVFLVSGWPALLWRGEAPRGRRYHWSLPVPQGPHDLARVAAGAIWVVMAGALVEVIRGLALPGFEQSSLLVNGGYLLGLVAIYSVASIPALVAANPARWFYGAIVACFLLLWGKTSSAVIDLDTPSLAPLIGRYGFAVAAGGNAMAMVTAESTTFEPARQASRPVVVDSAHEYDTVVTVNVVALPGGGAPVSDNEATAASALWIGGAIAVMLAISRARHEH